MNYRFERKLPGYDSTDAFLIWHPSERETYYDVPRDSWCMFRRTAVLNHVPKRGEVRIFADTRYILFVNGAMVGTGPCRSDPRWQYYDRIDISEHLHTGLNCIAVLVLFQGYGTGQSISRIPALCADIKITGGGWSMSLSTGSEWRCRLLRAHDPDSPRINGCKGRIEVFDNRRYDPDWINADYNDTGWNKCHLRELASSPFWNICRRPIPLPGRRTISAHSVISEGRTACTDDWDMPHLHFRIMNELSEAVLSPVKKAFPFRFDGSDKSLNCIIADFGGIYVGTAAIDAVGSEGDIIDIVYAEELFDGKPRFDGISYRPISRFILKQGENRLPVFFAYEAFRYIALIVRQKAELTINSVSVLTREYPFEAKAAFSCDNTEMNRLWDISTHTLEICLQDGYLDSPSREQQQWMGDGRYQAIMNYYYSGDSKMAEKLLLQIAQSQDHEGMTASRYPDGNHNLPPIPSYCLQWLCAFSDYYRFTGKNRLILTLYPNILNGIRWFSAFEGDEGLLFDIPYWNYCDMGENLSGEQGDFYRGGCNAFLNMLYAEAMESVILCARIAGDDEAEKFFTGKRTRLVAGIRKVLWNPKKRAYADSFVNGVISDSVSESVNALAVIGFEHGKRGQEILKSVFCPESRIGEVTEVSVYSMILLSRALKVLGQEALSVRLFLERYRNMLESGTDTVWEHWWLYREDSRGRKYEFSSACHAWGSSAIVLVAENILGISPEKAEIAIPEEVASELGCIRAEICLPGGRRLSTPASP